jgi:hypothetical protein
MRANPLKFAALRSAFQYGHNNRDWSSKCTSDLCLVTEAASVSFVVRNEVCSVKHLQIVNYCIPESNAALSSSASGRPVNPRCTKLKLCCVNGVTGTRKE